MGRVARRYNEVRKRSKEKLLGKRVTTRYFQRCRSYDKIWQFCVINPIGPQQVRTELPDGTWQEWPSHWEGDLLVFDAPDGYAGGPILYDYNPAVQLADAMVFESDKTYSFGGFLHVPQ